VDGAQSLHLLATKLALPPSRISLVPRPRLVSQFENAIAQRQRLILVAAPAGFGKTTAVAEWVHSAGHRAVAWLALDDADNQLNLFLAYLIAALETLQPRVGAEAWALLRGHAARPPTQAILTSLLNALATSAGEIILALDDYHAITLPAIHEAITFLLDRMPPYMHIILATRADPPLPLARLRARGQLAEVRAADLRFTREEAAYLFEQVHRIALPSDIVTTLESRTEGWATGLQLAALSLQQQDATHISTFLVEFSGSHTYVFDYLVDEVFQAQPDHVRRFLVQTSILERLCGPLSAAVTGYNDAQTVLERLDRANLFLMPLDTSRRWYRYHPLFRDFLHEQLERGVEAADRALLYRRASAWFEQQGLAGEAIEYALQAEAWSDALRCLTPLTASERLYEYYLDWPRWLAALPDAALQQVPDLCLRLAWILTFTGHAEAADRPLGLAEAAWQVAGNQLKAGEVLCWRAVALFYRRDVVRASQVGQQALVLLPAEAIEVRAISSLIVGSCELECGHVTSAMAPLVLAKETLQHSSDVFYSFAAAFALAQAYQFQGHLRRAAALYQDVIQRTGSVSHQSGPAPYIHLGILFYEWNDLPAAERTLREGIAVGQRTGRGRYWPGAYNTLAQVLWAHGEVAQAHAMIEQSLAVSKLLASPRNIAEAHSRQALLWLAQGDLPAVARWLTSRVLNIDDELSVERLSEYLILARIRIAQERQAPGSGDVDAVVHLLDRLLQSAQADERTSHQIMLLALLALSHAAGRNPNQALESLAAALGLAEPEGYIRTFVDEGAPMQSLLIAQRAHLASSDVDKRQLAYIDRLLHAFPPDILADSTIPTSSKLLSEREQAVLQLLAGGRSIQEIADLLIISSNTVRAHVKHIYAKLDVHNRVQALERARNLQLL
jgi:LuxR family maltose regulon positive regulatory protein